MINKTKRKETHLCNFSLFLTLKWLGGQFDPRYIFSKNVSSIEREKPYLFVTFTMILSHIFPENFINFSQVVGLICIS